MLHLHLVKILKVHSPLNMLDVLTVKNVHRLNALKFTYLWHKDRLPKIFNFLWVPRSGTVILIEGFNHEITTAQVRLSEIVVKYSRPFLPLQCSAEQWHITLTLIYWQRVKMPNTIINTPLYFTGITISLMYILNWGPSCRQPLL